MTILLIGIAALLSLRGGSLFARFQKQELLFEFPTYEWSPHYRDKSKPREAHWGDFVALLMFTLFLGVFWAVLHDVGVAVHSIFTSNALKSRPDELINLMSGAATPRSERKAEKLKAKNARIKELEAENARLEKELEL